MRLRHACEDGRTLLGHTNPPRHELLLAGTGSHGVLWEETSGKGTLDSPSNSAWPTPTMMMDIGSLAAWEKTGEGRVLGEG